MTQSLELHQKLFLGVLTGLRAGLLFDQRLSSY